MLAQSKARLRLTVGPQ